MNTMRNRDSDGCNAVLTTAAHFTIGESPMQRAVLHPAKLLSTALPNHSSPMHAQRSAGSFMLCHGGICTAVATAMKEDFCRSQLSGLPWKVQLL
jgi:hypothetical protein